MKRLIFLIMAVIAGYSAMAQPTAGNLFVGGKFSFCTETDKDKSGGTTEKNYTSTTFDLLPVAGYFISEKFAVGVQTGISTHIDKYPNGSYDKTTYTTFVLNPFARYYLISGTGGLFAEANMGIETGKSKTFYPSSTTEDNITTFAMGIAPGAYYYFTSKMAFECKVGWLGFSSHTVKYGSDYKEITSDFSLELNPSSIQFGIIYTLF